MEVAFFETPAEFRGWLEENHTQAAELAVGFRRKGSGRKSITWPEAVDQALCFGWIDGVRRSLDESSYMIRFTPRKSKSTWSAGNIARVDELETLGLMRPAGREAFGRREERRSRIYSYENGERGLDEQSEAELRTNLKAWEFFAAQPPGYRKLAGFWVSSAKREQTRLKRLMTLIEHSERGERLPALSRPRPEPPKASG